MSDTAARLDSHASAYTAAFPHYEENRIVHVAYGHRIASRLREAGLRQVLSLGIGHSEVARPLLQALRDGELDRHVLVDASPTILQEFRALIDPWPDGLALVEAFFESYDDPAGFDAIEAGFVLEHVEDPGVVLRRMRRLIHPQGRMFVAVPNARSLHRLLGHHAGLLPDLYRLSEADLALGHRRYFDVPTMRELVQSCGWSIESQAGLLLKPFTTGQLAKLGLGPEVWRALQWAAEGYAEIANAFCMELAPA